MSNIFHDNLAITKVESVSRLTGVLSQGESVVVATIVPKTKASFRTLGSKMLVDQNGKIIGDAEGGGLESKVVAEAATVFDTGRSRLVYCDQLGSLADKEAGITGNIDLLFLEKIEPDAKTLQLFQTLKRQLAGGLRSLLLSSVSPRDDAQAQGMERSLLGPDGVLAGTVPCAPLLQEALGRGRDLQVPITFGFEGRRYFLEPFLPLDPLYLVGAGRVARLAARLAALAAFRVVVMDDDPGFANQERFPLADEVVVLESFGDCFRERALGADASVVVITRGHAHDTEVLAQALQTKAGYVGMMGCKTDGLARVAKVGQTGMTSQALARVHCPIGLPIGGATPEETALSIVAELIAARTQRQQ